MAAGRRPLGPILFSGNPLAGRDAGTRHSLADWGVSAEAWSVTSYKALREGRPRSRALEPAPPRQRTASARRDAGPARGSGSYRGGDRLLKAVPDQIARFVAAPFTPLGTDGFGRSDTRGALREAFRGRRRSDRGRRAGGIGPAGEAKASEVAAAIEKYGVDAEAPDPGPPDRPSGDGRRSAPGGPGARGARVRRRAGRGGRGPASKLKAATTCCRISACVPVTICGNLEVKLVVKYFT